ncbi:MAG: eL32 family ribosomal protein [Candidatus Nanoarchaeia archaeon]
MAKKFIRKDTHKKKRLALVWRKPKGITNKKRLNRKGHSPNVRPGYGTKDTERGKNKQGLLIVQVSTMDQLNKINPKTEAALISGLGKKKKLEMIAQAEKQKITLANFNAKAYKEQAQKFLELKKTESTQKKQEQKKAEKVELEEKIEQKEKEEKTQEQKKKEEKEEKDKVLLKGQ